MRRYVVTSLDEVPVAVYAEFTSTPVENQRKFEWIKMEGRFCVRIDRSKEFGENGPFTLVLRERICSLGKSNSSELMVFDFPITSEGLAPGENTHPLLRVEFFAPEPNPRHSKDARWEEGRGYWVKEKLTCSYQPRDEKVCVTSEFGDWEFGFLLKIQHMAHDLARGVTCRGHWESDWNKDPNKTFKTRPLVSEL